MNGSKPKAPSPMKQIPSARELAVDLLTKIEQEKAYSNVLLHHTLLQHKLSSAESGLLTELTYGTIQRLNTLDYLLNQVVAKGINKLQPWVRSLLRLSLYQLLYLDRIPSRAVVHEAVNISKRRGHSGISGMVNAVLRRAAAWDGKPPMPKTDENPIQQIALEFSHPQWLISRWVNAYGLETTKLMCASNNLPPHTSVRINTMHHSRESVLAQLHADGIIAIPSPLAPSGIVIQGAGNMAFTPYYTQGEISIQDESSMLVAEAVAPQAGMKVLDCCSAPGGKSTHMAELMNNQGEVWSCDLHSHKLRFIEEQAKRLSITCIHPMAEDARLLGKHFPPDSFDRILLDAPCSGFGVVRRKPDLKWSRQESAITELAKLQQELIRSVYPLLKPGGFLVYSTCTTEEQENGEVVRTFLADYPDMSIASFPASMNQLSSEGMIQILPHQYHSDGFFIARLYKRIV